MIIVGLGNPGEEYKNTRHNAGCVVLDVIRKKINASDFEYKKILNAKISSGNIGSEKVMLVAPQTFMNNSGESLRALIKNEEDLSSLVVLYDDLDLPIGSMKISFDRGTGGHKGLDSIVNHIKSSEFIRLRIGISPKNEEGEIDKIKGGDAVDKYVLGNFTKNEIIEIEKIADKVFDALQILLNEGLQKAMTIIN